MTSIDSFSKVTTGKTVIIPDGTYTGGNIKTPHTGTLILKAANRGKAIIDCSAARLNVYPGGDRVVLDGFKIKNGSAFVVGASDVTFKNCDFTFPADEWYRQWVAAGGGHDKTQEVGLAALKSMINGKPSGLVYQAYQGKRSDRGSVLGCDFHDLGSSGIELRNGTGHHIAGTRVWNCTEMMQDGSTCDPGYGGAEVQPLGGQTDAFHNDALFSGGGVHDAIVEHSCFLNRIQWGAQVASLGNDHFIDLWLAGSVTAGIVCDQISPNVITGGMSTIRSWACKYGVRVDIGRSPAKGNRTWPAVYFPAFTMAGVNLAPASGTTDAYGKLLTDKTLAHASNPANVWRSMNL